MAHQQGTSPQGSKDKTPVWSLFPRTDMNYHGTPDGRGPGVRPLFVQPYSGVDSDGSDDLELNVPFHKRTVVTRNISLDQLYDQAQSYGVQVTAQHSPKPRSEQNLERKPMHISIPTRMSNEPQEEGRSSFQERRQNRQDVPERPPTAMSSSIQSPTSVTSRSASPSSYHTNLTSLPALQQKGYDDQLEPLLEEEIGPGSFDLVAPGGAGAKVFSLEKRSEQLFSTEHLRIIFKDPSLLLRFTAFLSAHRTSSIPILIYYLDSVKALKAIGYSNAIAEALDPIEGFDFTRNAAKTTVNEELQEKSRQAFEAMVREDLPAYITHIYIQTVSLSIQRRITDTLPSHLREASEGLAEVFCLTDPSRPDNPIVFSSEEFHRTTQYGMTYVIGRNCRFLQGPKTNPFSVKRIRERIEDGKEHCEVFLNYRRDGSPFMNLLMCAPLTDSRGVIRYFIGAQVDVSGLVKECSDIDSLRQLVRESEGTSDADDSFEPANKEKDKDEFQELSEMLNLQELDTVRKWGGRMHKESYEDTDDSNGRNANWNKPRLVISSISQDGNKDRSTGTDRLSGIYENYLLVRPYPTLRILFASPSLRVPGILQSPLMKKIGGSSRVRDELTQALADGRGVTAKVRWISKNDPEGRSRWMHCTPLIGSNSAIGVWMIVLVDDEDKGKRFRQAPAVDPKFGRSVPFSKAGGRREGDGSSFDLGTENDKNSLRGRQSRNGTDRSGSPYTVRIDD